MKKIEINPTNEIHILRHFIEVDKKYLSTLVGKPYWYYDIGTNSFKETILNEHTIVEILKTTGSKFFRNVPGIENPRKLIKLIQEGFAQRTPRWQKHSSGRLYSFLINYKYPVGNKNLVHIDMLSDDEKTKVKKIKRGKHIGEESVRINVLTGAKMQKISTIEVVILDNQQLPFYFVTAYPGTMMKTEDFPNTRQTKEEYKRSVDFWNEHVFLK